MDAERRRHGVGASPMRLPGREVAGGIPRPSLAARRKAGAVNGNLLGGPGTTEDRRLYAPLDPSSVGVGVGLTRQASAPLLGQRHLASAIGSAPELGGHAHQSHGGHSFDGGCGSAEASYGYRGGSGGSGAMRRSSSASAVGRSGDAVRPSTAGHQRPPINPAYGGGQVYENGLGSAPLFAAARRRPFEDISSLGGPYIRNAEQPPATSSYCCSGGAVAQRQVAHQLESRLSKLLQEQSIHAVPEQSFNKRPPHPYLQQAFPRGHKDKWRGGRGDEVEPGPGNVASSYLTSTAADSRHSTPNSHYEHGRRSGASPARSYSDWLGGRSPLGYSTHARRSNAPRTPGQHSNLNSSYNQRSQTPPSSQIKVGGLDLSSFMRKAVSRQPTEESSLLSAINGRHQHSQQLGTIDSEASVLSESRLKIYSDLFEEVIERDRVFGSLLRKIKTAYDSVIMLASDSQQVPPMPGGGHMEAGRHVRRWDEGVDPRHTSNEPTTRNQSIEMMQENQVLKDLVERLHLELEESVRREQRWKHKAAKAKLQATPEQAAHGHQFQQLQQPMAPPAGPPPVMGCGMIPSGPCYDGHINHKQKQYHSQAPQHEMSLLGPLVPVDQHHHGGHHQPAQRFHAMQREPHDTSQVPSLNQGGLLSMSSISAQQSPPPPPMQGCDEEDTARSTDSGYLPQRPTPRRRPRPANVPKLDFQRLRQLEEEDRQREEYGEYDEAMEVDEGEYDEGLEEELLHHHEVTLANGVRVEDDGGVNHHTVAMYERYCQGGPDAPTANMFRNEDDEGQERHCLDYGDDGEESPEDVR